MHVRILGTFHNSHAAKNSNPGAHHENGICFPDPCAIHVGPDCQTQTVYCGAHNTLVGHMLCAHLEREQPVAAEQAEQQEPRGRRHGVAGASEPRGRGDLLSRGTRNVRSFSCRPLLYTDEKERPAKNGFTAHATTF
jgi:hypothetical protein